MNDILQLDKWTKQCQHHNSEMALTLYLAEDVQRLVNLDKLPSNIRFGGHIPEF
jgi:hypothetical protein